MFVPVEVRGCLCIQLHVRTSSGEVVRVQLHIHTSSSGRMRVQLHAHTSRGEVVGVKLLSACLPPQGPQSSSCQSQFQEADAGVFAQCSQH